MTLDSAGTGTLHDGAWESTSVLSGGTLGVGVVPEPGTVLPTALLLLSALTLRRKRR